MAHQLGGRGVADGFQVQVNGQALRAQAGETLLQAALRSGVAFPHSCRVGGCGSCKCRVLGGEVRELTESGYLLSADELAQGTVLACQSVPRSDLQVAVDLAPRGVPGRVLSQRALSAQVMELRVQLDQPLHYQAGQYAELRLEGLDARGRCYSYAAPCSADGVLRFFVQRVEGGAFSAEAMQTALVGRRIWVDGPKGDFVLRPGSAPLLMVAGGSGLAPILAMLQQARADGDARAVTVLLAARREEDLIALDELQALARAWPTPFRVIPVLSGRGEVLSAVLARHARADMHAYVCGSPRLVDGVSSALRRLGVSAGAIHADRFSSPDAPRTSAHWLDYAKYFLFHAIGAYALVSLLAGGIYTTAGLLGVLALYMLGDALSGDDTRTPAFKHPRLLTVQLWMALPLLTLIVLVSVWTVAPGDPLGLGAWIQHWTGFDALAARAATSTGHHLSGLILTGLMIGMIGTIPAHELTHRTWDRVSLLIGRWLLAYSYDAAFAIEHVYGHHRYVATRHDPATAPRGRSVYWHILVSTWRGNVSAWQIEAARLRKRGLPVLGVHNALLRGYAMSLTLLLAAYALAGITGALWFSACALWGKALLEIVNYMEHYGLVRDPAEPVQPRHSWNTNCRVSSWAMFNLTRHSHHHAQGEVAYQDLRPYPDAPMMINGYLTTIVIALIPPLWHALMAPKVAAWDRDYASPREQQLLQEAAPAAPALREQAHA